MPVEFKLPDLGEGIHEGEIIEIFVSVGDRVVDGQTVMVVETDKAVTEVPAPVTGVVREIRVKPGDMVRVGDVLMVFEEEGRAKAPEAQPARAETVGAGSAGPTVKADAVKEMAGAGREGPVVAAPSTRRLARELDVDLRLVTPTGPGGRVTAEDVQAFAARRGKAPEAAPEAPAEEARVEISVPEAPALPDFDRLGPVERIPLRSVRRATAKHMAIAWSRIPHVSHQDEADITKLEALRKKFADEIKARGGALSLTPFALKAAVAGLKAYPRFNSSLDEDKGEVVVKKYYNIGVAVDTERGLVVPVVRNVDCKSVGDLAKELPALAERTRQGKNDREDLTGGSFTITNLGPFGGTGFSPLVNYPEVAILGLGKAKLKPVVVGNEDDFKIVPRLMLPLVVGFDHRVVDGADAARFLNLIIRVLESPEDMLVMV